MNRFHPSPGVLMNGGIGMEQHSFYTGTEPRAYEWLGAHPKEDGTLFRAFAPAAAGVSVVGEWNDWQETTLYSLADGSFYEGFIPEARPGMAYLLRIHRTDGTTADHLDPYSFASRKVDLPVEDTAEVEAAEDEDAPAEPQPTFRLYSVIWDRSAYTFHDEKWMDRRTDGRTEPMNIYELHLGSWREGMGYRSIAAPLLDYLEEMGYNCLELMPVCEYPAEESWGYQAVSYYAPTQRYGSPDDLKYLVDECHRRGVRVILDLALVHFAVDSYGLGDFDGTPLYEYPRKDWRLSEWGSKNFNYSRGAIRSFLLSSVLFWLREYHFDGVRLDAVRNMLYPHGNTDMGIHLDGVKFLRTLTDIIKAAEPTACLVAEDSSAYPGVTKPVRKGGLGFDYKWDMGWMNDTLSFFQKDPGQRRDAYHQLSFSMFYYYSERFLMPFSHDEVVHGKATILQKMNGDYEGKFPQCRALTLYMYAHPGKKLNFMGNELGQLREWDEKREQDWNLLEYPAHQQYQRFARELNQMYLASPALWQRDFRYSGFRWLDCEPGNLVYAFLRESREQLMLAVFNFDAEGVPEYRVELPAIDLARLVFDTNWDKYGGEVEHQPLWLDLEDGGLTLSLEPFSGKLFTLQRGAEYVVTEDDELPDAIEGVDEVLTQPTEGVQPMTEEELAAQEPEEEETTPEPEAEPELELEPELAEQVQEEHNEWFRALTAQEQEKLLSESAYGRNNYGQEELDEEALAAERAAPDTLAALAEKARRAQGEGSDALSAQRYNERSGGGQPGQPGEEHDEWFWALSPEEREKLLSGSAYGRNNYGQKEDAEAAKEETE